MKSRERRVHSPPARPSKQSASHVVAVESVDRRLEALPIEHRRLAIPGIIADEGQWAAFKFLEFFAARTRNSSTRRAYYRNAVRFCQWLSACGLSLRETSSVHVSTYIEQLSEQNYSKPTVKQHLAAIRELFDWLIVGQVIAQNPAWAVRGPKHVVESGTTPVLSAEDATQLLAVIDTTHAVGCRDKALIGTMIYTFGRVHAVLDMDIDNYYSQGKKWWVRLGEKNGKVLKMPAHHLLEESLDRYIAAAGGRDSFPLEQPTRTAVGSQPRRPLFRTTAGRSRRLTNRRMTQADAWRMVRRRARDAGIDSPIGNHTFRATGITDFLRNDGKLEDAQRMAGHRSSRTTKLYDRRDESLSLDEIERIRIGRTGVDSRNE